MKFLPGFAGWSVGSSGTRTQMNVLLTSPPPIWNIFLKIHNLQNPKLMGNSLCSIKHRWYTTCNMFCRFAKKRPDSILWWDHIDLIVRKPNHYRIMKLYCNGFVKIPQMITIFKGMLQWSMASCEHTVHMQTPKLVAIPVRCLKIHRAPSTSHPDVSLMLTHLTIW